MSECVGYKMSVHVSEHMSDRMPDKMSEHVSECTSIRMSDSHIKC